MQVYLNCMHVSSSLPQRENEGDASVALLVSSVDEDNHIDGSDDDDDDALNVEIV